MNDMILPLDDVLLRLCAADFFCVQIPGVVGFAFVAAVVPIILVVIPGACVAEASEPVAPLCGFCFAPPSGQGISGLSARLQNTNTGFVRQRQSIFRKREDVITRNVGNFLGRIRRFGFRAHTMRAARFPVYPWASYGLS